MIRKDSSTHGTTDLSVLDSKYQCRYSKDHCVCHPSQLQQHLKEYINTHDLYHHEATKSLHYKLGGLDDHIYRFQLQIKLDYEQSIGKWFEN